MIDTGLDIYGHPLTPRTNGNPEGTVGLPEEAIERAQQLAARGPITFGTEAWQELTEAGRSFGNFLMKNVPAVRDSEYPANMAGATLVSMAMDQIPPEAIYPLALGAILNKKGQE